MKRISTILLLFLSILLLSVPVRAQISQGGCSDYKNYKKLRDERSDLKAKQFPMPLTAYAETEQEALYQAKIMVLKQLTGNQQYLNNPRIDSVFAEFAGEIVLFNPKEYDLFKTRRRDRDRGKYTCMVHKVMYNPELIDFMQIYINNFIKYSVTFIINPYIEKDGDPPTKKLYNEALNTFKTLCLQPKYKFDNVVEDRMLEKSNLPEKPDNYNPAKGYRAYKTGNKYLDYVASITNNANRSRQIDVVFSVDSISISNAANSNQRLVNFHLIGYNTHTANLIMAYDSKITVEADNDFDAVKKAIPQVFENDIDQYMYDISKRYSNYARDGVLFSLKIADSLIDQNTELILAQKMLDCKLFAEGSITPGVWRNNGQQIGKSFEGRTYLLDRLRLQIMMMELLKSVGIEDFKIDVSGSDFIITQKK